MVKNAEKFQSVFEYYDFSRYNSLIAWIFVTSALYFDMYFVRYILKFVETFQYTRVVIFWQCKIKYLE